MFNLCPWCGHANTANACDCNGCRKRLNSSMAAPEVGLTLILLDLGEPAPASPDPKAADSLPEMVRSDPDPDPVSSPIPQPASRSPVPAWVAGVPPTLPLSSAVPDATGPARALPSKADRRAAVRRARLARDAPASATATGPREVLVFDGVAATQAELCALLTGFGFIARPARTHDEAFALLASHSFAAVFLDIVLDGYNEGIAFELCLRAKSPPAANPDPGSAAGSFQPGALIILGAATRPVERVRASMAGADQFLVRPASRGALAKALDACGVKLPSDPRRAA
jgi:CheY-like chemotaxis protein